MAGGGMTSRPFVPHDVTVILPTVGVRAHRIFLTKRSAVERLVRCSPPVRLGPPVDHIPVDRPLMAAMLSVLCVLCVVAAGCVAVRL